MDGPLKNLLVVDLTRVLVGPYCTMILSDLGARVIKVEAPEIGDDSRKFGPFIEDYSAYFMSLNRGKESIALNLKNSEDKKIFDKILSKADILVENFKPGTLKKWGYGWEEVSKKFPKLIYASASGFGQTGPLKELPAYDMVVQGMGGLMSVTGQPNSEPTRVGTSIGDITAGLFTTIGINAALYDRQKTGKGMYIDVSMLDCQIAILENAIARYLSKNEIPKPMGSRHPSIAPFEAFKTKDSYIIIAAGNDKLFEKVKRHAHEVLEPEMKAIDPSAGFKFEELSAIEGLDIDPGEEVVTLAKTLAGRNDHAKVAFGTEAGLFQQDAGIPTVVCGPGGIDQAHKPNEFVALEQIDKCHVFFDKLMDHVCK